jgi:undecaprenyl-diphosphatase
MTAPLLSRLSAHDRALMLRCAIPPTAPRISRAAWTAITHLGGTGPSLLAAGLPWLAGGALQQISKLALATVIVSHFLVQIIKRTVVRSRPAKVEHFSSLVNEPDRFSFPSGHATASMSVALIYGAAYPAWAGPLLLFAVLVGFSRVRLRVHYPSDVLVGQFIAALTAGLLASI